MEESQDMIIKRLENQVKMLQEKNEKNENFLSGIFKFADIAIVDTSADMNVVYSIGDIDNVFMSARDSFDHGKNLVKLVYKATKNIHEKTALETEATEKRENLEDTVMRFADSSKSGKTIEIVGEQENGDSFLMTWRIERNSKKFRHFFKITPTNNIVKKVTEEAEKNIKNYRKRLWNIFDHISDGLTIINLKNKIEYINENAKKSFIPADNHVLMRATMQDKYFHEVFSNVPKEEINEIMETVNRTMKDKVFGTFSRTVNKQEINYEVYPMIDTDDIISGAFVISRNPFKNNPVSANGNQQKLISTLEKLSGDYKILLGKAKTLNQNNKVLKEKIDNYKIHLKWLNSVVKKLPYPVTIQSLPKGNYEFVNSAFEKESGIALNHIKGKKDAEILPGSVVKEISAKNEISLKTNSPVSISSEGITASQAVLFDSKSRPTHLIRIYSRFNVNGKSENK